MPSDDCFWLDNRKHGSPVGPAPRKPDPEDAVARAQLGTPAMVLEDGQLLAKGQVFNRKTGFGNEHRAKQQKPNFQNAHLCTGVNGKCVILAEHLTACQTTKVLGCQQGRNSC